MRFGFPSWSRKSTSASTAKERLQILLAHDRAGSSAPDCLPELQRDILAVIERHMKIDRDAVDINMQRGSDYSSLEINIEFPAARRP